jgi:hypothetical protein
MRINRSVTWIAIIALAITSLAITSPAEAQRRSAMQVGPKCAGGVGALFDEIEPVALLDFEETAVLYMWEEEKLARDVYLALANTWQLPIFGNIAEAEERHMALVWKLIETYGIVHQFTDDTPGVFVDTSLAQLYVDLVARGELSLIDGLEVGADIEDLDLYDLYQILEATENDHLQLVFRNLAKGSRNHLRAFVRALAAQDVTYAPTFLDPTTYDAILAADMERRMFYGADGEVIPACGRTVGGFGMGRGINGNGGNNGNNGNGGQDTGSGSGSGECDGTGGGSGECDGSGPNGGPNAGNGSGGGN